MDKTLDANNFGGSNAPSDASTPSGAEAQAVPQPSGAASITSVTLSLPPFYEHDPLLWFVFLEAEFENHRIRADNSKYNQLLVRLPQQVAAQVRNILIRPPASGKYEALKEAVLSKVMPSGVARAQQLLSSCQLGDQRPSALLTQMQQVLGDWQVHESLLREFWMQKLPVSMQSVLSVVKDRPLSEVANLADEVAERYGTQPSQVTAVTNFSPPTQTPNQPDSIIATMLAEIAALRRDFQSLSLNQRRRSSSLSRTPRSRSSSRVSRSRTPSPGSDGLCWYHATFGDKAHRCRSPCSHRLARGN